MVDIHLVLASIFQFFYFLRATFARIFVSRARSNTKPGDIEAGAPAETDVKHALPCPHPHQLDLESGIHCQTCHWADFVEISLDSQDQPKGSKELNPDNAIAFGSPIRLPSSSLVRDGQEELRLERRSRKRGSLFDLISQFPDVPRHLPPGPIAFVNPSAGRQTDISSPTSSKNSSPTSTVSDNSSYGFASNDTLETSAPGTPQTQSDETLFAFSGQAFPVSQGKDNMANFRFGGRYSGRALTSQAELLCSACKRPQSLVWFADATLDLPVIPTKVEDEVLIRELMLWEESRQLGLKAFREADAQDMWLFNPASRGA